jgi:hypothetical protein
MRSFRTWAGTVGLLAVAGVWVAVFVVSGTCDEAVTECGDVNRGLFLNGSFASVLLVPLSAALLATPGRITMALRWRVPLRRLVLVAGIAATIPLGLCTFVALDEYVYLLRPKGPGHPPSSDAYVYTFFAAIWAAVALPLLGLARRMKSET